MNPWEAAELLERHMKSAGEPIRSAIGMMLSYVGGLESLTRKLTENRDVLPGDVIQLSPEASNWGPLLCIVDKVIGEGDNQILRAYWFQVETRGEPPGRAYVRVKRSEVARVGRAEWIVQDQSEDAGEET